MVASVGARSMCYDVQCAVLVLSAHTFSYTHHTYLLCVVIILHQYQLSVPLRVMSAGSATRSSHTATVRRWTSSTTSHYVHCEGPSAVSSDSQTARLTGRTDWLGYRITSHRHLTQRSTPQQRNQLSTATTVSDVVVAHTRHSQVPTSGTASPAGCRLSSSVRRSRVVS